MSYEDGMAAINLQMPRRIPRTEYSADFHWDLVKAVTGIDVGLESPPHRRREAAKSFCIAWDYGLFWNTLIGRDEFGSLCTDMGHAAYAAGGEDYRPVGKQAFDDPEQVLRLEPEEAFGVREPSDLVRRFEQNYRDACQANPGGVNMTGIYITLLSGLIDLLGWDMLLLAAGTDLARFGDLADRYARWMQRYFDALAQADVPVVMIHDDIVWTSGAFIHPDWYRRYVFPNYKRYFDPLRESGKRILFTSDGNYTQFIDDVVAAGVHGLAMEPSTDMAYVAHRYGKTHVFIGNADTRILLRGSQAQIRDEVQRCIDIGKGCPGFFLAVGNHIPPNTPVASAIYYNQVYEELRNRW